MRKITILGSTGSIGVQTLKVLDNMQDVRIAALTAKSNIKLLEEQARKYKPDLVAVMEGAYELEKNLSDMDTIVYGGMGGIVRAVSLTGVSTIVNAIVGSVGLRPTIAAIKARKNIALANKETLVMAGELITKMASANNVSIYPIDSEHSAVFQCLQGNYGNPIHKIYLTASGGPFLGKSRDELRNITVADALKHPNWSMGAKISIDSATMMNKGLELIEAMWLFGLKRKQVDVLVHPQSIVHSMVEFCDGSVMAQLGEPDMRVPISYALTYPHRQKNDFPKIDFLSRNILSFEAPDLDAFPCLRLAFEAIDIGGTMPTVLNAANEAAVSLFLNNKISFLEISELIEKAMQAYTVQSTADIASVFAADTWGRNFVNDMGR